MIIDRIDNASLYKNLTPRLSLALTALTQGEILRWPLGRHELDGDRVFALIQEYNTKPRDQGVWEAHRKYIDIQVIVEGAEIMGHAFTNEMQVTTPYDAQKDVMFLRGGSDAGSFVRVSAGMFTIFHPHDAHMPNLAVDAPAPVRKVVFKVLAQ